MRLLHLSLFLVFTSTSHSETLKDAGIYIRLSQKAVNYIAELASEAIPSLLNQLNPPDTNSPSAKTSKTLIHTVTKPKTDIKFIEGKGFRANILFPYIRVSSDLQVAVFVFEYAGSFQAEFHNLTLEMELHYSQNETTTRNVIEAKHCAVNHSDLIISFPPDSSLATLRTEIEDAIITKLRGAFCDIAVQALQFVDDQNLEEVVAEEPIVSDGTEFSPGELGYSICKPKTVVEDTTTTSEPTGVTTTTTEEPVAPANESLSWSANFSMAYPPIFRKDDVVVGLDGGIMMNGQPAQNVLVPVTQINRSSLDTQMIGIAISEYVPNTMLAHIYDNDLGQFSETFTAENLPRAIKKLGKLVCSRCYFTIAGSIVEVQIDKILGARIRLSANLTIKFQGRQKLHQLIQAKTTLHVKPSIRHSRVYGDISLTSVDVNVFEVAVTGALAKPIERFVSFIIPKVLWPQVKKRFRFALNQRGFQLPVICGLEFEQMKLFYVDHAVLLTTDFQFDLPMFVEKFKKYLQFKASLNPSLPKYLDMD